MLVGAVGIESTNCMETKEFCGAAWPSKVLKGKRGNFYCPLIAPEKFADSLNAFKMIHEDTTSWRPRMIVLFVMG